MNLFHLPIKTISLPFNPQPEPSIVEDTRDILEMLPICKLVQSILAKTVKPTPEHTEMAKPRNPCMILRNALSPMEIKG